MIRPILLAEDLPDDAGVIQHLLRRAGIANPVIVVPDGVEAIAYLNGDDFYADRIRFPLPSVVFLDLKMPRRDDLKSSTGSVVSHNAKTCW